MSQQTTLIKLKLYVPRFYISFQILRVFQRMALIAHGEFLSMSGDVCIHLSINYLLIELSNTWKSGQVNMKQINLAAPENIPNRRVNY